VGLLERRGDLEGRKVLVTAGPTREALDPVRYLSNRSSGKMGYALAREAALRGAEVTLVSGPVALEPPFGVRVERVVTAAEMAEAVERHFPEADILLMAAAVADYRAEEVLPEKRKKGKAGWTLRLVPNPDILGSLGKRKKKGQFLCGFAAETENLKANAQKKLREKGLDLIAANDVSREGLGFDSDRNALLLLFAGGREERIREGTKAECARALLDAVVEELRGR
jgi:phosphopantothenoylcysteine decarboxylase/phosphopantothenate--cysteine ligase